MQLFECLVSPCLTRLSLLRSTWFWYWWYISLKSYIVWQCFWQINFPLYILKESLLLLAQGGTYDCGKSHLPDRSWVASIEWEQCVPNKLCTFVKTGIRTYGDKRRRGCMLLLLLLFLAGSYRERCMLLFGGSVFNMGVRSVKDACY